MDAIKNNPEDYIGKKYPGTELLVLYKTKIKNRVSFNVICSCGTQKVIRRSDLVAGSYISCGSADCKYSQQNIRKDKASLFRDDAESFNINGSVLAKYKKNAEDRGYSFEITVEDIFSVWKKQGHKCALTGVSLKCGTNSRNHNWSIDRIDNSVGYTKDNIHIVHKTINIFRNKFSIKEFVLMCNLVSNNNVNSDNKSTEDEILTILSEALKDK